MSRFRGVSLSPVPEGRALLRLEQAPDPGAAHASAGGVALIVTRRGDRVAAFRNVCPHAGFPLEREDGGFIIDEGRYLLCAAHCASFELETGACVGGPCNGFGLEPIAIEVREGVIFTLGLPRRDRD